MRDINGKKKFVRYLAIYGCFSAGIMYLVIGVFAILSYYKIKDAGADESSILAVLNNYIVGYIFVCIILLGTLSFICWRIYEAVKDPYQYGSKVKGVGKRIGIALTTIPDILIVYSAVTALFGTSTANEDGRPLTLRETITDALNQWGGKELIIITGVVVLFSAIIQFIYGTTGAYKERLAMDNLAIYKKRIINFLGISGYIARGTILSITAFFFIKAGLTENAEYAVNTDRSFELVAKVGEVPFLAVAIATIFYSFFMFVFGIYYDTGIERCTK